MNNAIYSLKLFSSLFGNLDLCSSEDHDSKLIRSTV